MPFVSIVAAARASRFSKRFKNVASESPPSPPQTPAALARAAMILRPPTLRIVKRVRRATPFLLSPENDALTTAGVDSDIADAAFRNPFAVLLFADLFDSVGGGSAPIIIPPNFISDGASAPLIAAAVFRDNPKRFFPSGHCHDWLYANNSFVIEWIERILPREPAGGQSITEAAAARAAQAKRFADEVFWLIATRNFNDRGAIRAFAAVDLAGGSSFRSPDRYPDFRAPVLTTIGRKVDFDNATIAGIECLIARFRDGDGMRRFDAKSGSEAELIEAVDALWNPSELFERELES